jgi:hypothetical protein
LKLLKDCEKSNVAVPELVEAYVRLPPEDIAYLKFVLESYETVGFLRTIDPQAATLVVFLVPEFAGVGRAILEAVSREIPLTVIDKPATLGDDWLVASAFGEPD